MEDLGKIKLEYIKAWKQKMEVSSQKVRDAVIESYFEILKESENTFNPDEVDPYKLAKRVQSKLPNYSILKDLEKQIKDLSPHK